MRLSKKGNCPLCQKALRTGSLYVYKGRICHFACAFPPLPYPSNPMPQTERTHAAPPLPPHDAQ